MVRSVFLDRVFPPPDGLVRRRLFRKRLEPLHIFRPIALTISAVIACVRLALEPENPPGISAMILLP